MGVAFTHDDSNDLRTRIDQHEQKYPAQTPSGLISRRTYEIDYLGERYAEGVDEKRVEDVRLVIYGELSRSGLAPSTAKLAAETGLDPTEVESALARLAANRDIVLRRGQIVMAHPFATIPLGFSVMGRKTLWWGGCAWDSFAIAHLVPDEPEVLVATQCPQCGTAHAWQVSREGPPAGSQVAHFLVPTKQIWEDVVHSCHNQRIFCDSGCVNEWLRSTGNESGYEMDLSTLWRLARGWYAGRLDRGYVRREPLLAAEYFASVGLRGPFWGL